LKIFIDTIATSFIDAGYVVNITDDDSLGIAVEVEGCKRYFERVKSSYIKIATEILEMINQTCCLKPKCKIINKVKKLQEYCEGKDNNG